MRQYTEAQKAGFKRRFSAIRRRQVALLVPVIAVALLMALSEDQEAVLGIPTTVLGPVALVLVLAAVVFSLYNWRCPACNKYLGRTINPRFCTRCGAELS